MAQDGPGTIGAQICGGQRLIPDPIRTQVRAAIQRAWDEAVRTGALPALPDDVAPPTVDVARPANADHGDLATNLAMRLAKPYRKFDLARMIRLALDR